MMNEKRVGGYMYKVSNTILLKSLVASSLLLSGCAIAEETTSTSPYTPVQDYDGKAFALPNGEEMSQFAKSHRKEVSAAALNYLKTKYKLQNTKVTNLVGAQNAVVAHVSSDDLPTFYTSVIVFVRDGKISDVSEVEGKVEGSIMSVLYVKAYEKEFQNLGKFCKKMTEKYPVVGMRQDAIENVFEMGVVRPNYYVSITDLSAPSAFKLYKKNHNSSSEQLRREIEKELKVSEPQITLTFFIKKRFSDPDKQLGQKLISNFKQYGSFPPGLYAFFLNSNEILKDSGIGKSHKGTDVGKDEIQINLKGQMLYEY
ncbi:DUF1672 family protein [Fictibacillus macauensis]|nr:DUF1672 family protein [Fictibacillus macauensis]